MKTEEIKNFIIDVLCADFHKRGDDSGIYKEELVNRLKLKGAYQGPTVTALDDLTDNGTIKAVGFTSTPYYSIKRHIYKVWLAEKEEGELLDNPRWQPLSVEKYEDLAGQADTLAEALEKDNGYNAEHYEEAKYTIEETKNFSTSLREGEGNVLRVRLDRIFEILERLSVIFNKTTIIGKLVITTINLFKTLLP